MAVRRKKASRRTGKHLFQKGHAKYPGSGRKKGQQNKFTRDMKDAALQAFNELGGADWLIRMAKGSAATRRTMIQFFGKVIPLSKNTSEGTPDENAAAIRERLKQMKDAGG